MIKDVETYQKRCTDLLHQKLKSSCATFVG